MLLDIANWFLLSYYFSLLYSVILIINTLVCSTKHFNIYRTFSYYFCYFTYRIGSLAHSQEHWMWWILKGCFIQQVTPYEGHPVEFVWPALSCIINAYFRIISLGLTFFRQHYVALCQPVITSHRCQWCSKASGGSREAVISDLYKDKKREKNVIYGGAICAVYNKF